MNTITTDQFPTFKAAARLLGNAPRATVRLLRWMAHTLRRLLFSRTSLKCYLILATLICLTYTSLRWYGRRAWEAEKERAAKAGMAADFAALSQPMPPEEDNFLAAPVFGDWSAEPGSNRDKFKMWFSKRLYVSPPKGINKTSAVPRPKVDTLSNWCAYFRLTGMLPVIPTQTSPAAELAADERWKPVIDAVYEAAKRPTAAIPLPGRTNHPYLNYYLTERDIPLLQKSIQLYARAQLDLGNLSEVLPAFVVTHHFCQAIAPNGEPFFEFTSSLRSEISLLKTGIMGHRWPESLLKDLLAANYPELLQQHCQAMFQRQRLKFIGRYQKFPDSIFGPDYAERSVGYPWRIILSKHLVPDIIFTQAMVRGSQFYGALNDAAAPLGPEEAWPSKLEVLAGKPAIDSGPKKIFGDLESKDWTPNLELYHFYLSPLMEASLRHLAIASELHFLKHSRYPANLTELSQRVPIPAIAMKDIDGQPIRYSTNEAGTWFTLTSIGSNGIPRTPGDRGYNITFSTAPDSQPK